MTRPVVITRPLAQAEPFAERAMLRGHQVIVFPLLEIHPLEDSEPLRAALNELPAYAMVAFVSPNAIDAAFAIQRDWPRDVVLAVMGEGSRACLVKHGVDFANTKVVSPRDTDRTDSQTLIDTLDLTALKGRRVLVVRGESGRDLLADALHAAGALVTQVAAYRRTPPSLDADKTNQLRRLLETQNDWIVTSSESLRILLELANRVAGETGVSKLQHQRIIVPHVRIAETARALGFADLTLTGSGDERLLAALQSPR